jgi:hypothetical protein
MTDKKKAEDAPRMIVARATVNLQGLRRGREAVVDPSIPYIARALETGALVSSEPAGD